MSDLKFAVRMLLKNPGFTAVAVITLSMRHRTVLNDAGNHPCHDQAN